MVVPLGKRTLTGVVVGAGANFDRSFEIRDIREVLDDGAFVPTDVVALTEWVSDYYLSGPGAALAAALPPRGLTARVDAFKTVRIAQLTAAGLDAGGSAVEHAALHQRHRSGCAPGKPDLPSYAWREEGLSRQKQRRASVRPCSPWPGRLTACRSPDWPSAAFRPPRSRG